jgi:hypothetical protein
MKLFAFFLFLIILPAIITVQALEDSEKSFKKKTPKKCQKVECRESLTCKNQGCGRCNYPLSHCTG